MFAAGEPADSLGDHRIGLFAVVSGQRPRQFDLGCAHDETEHSAKRGERIDVGQSRTAERLDEAFGGKVTGCGYRPSGQHQWCGIGVLTDCPPDGGCDGFHVCAPIVRPAWQFDVCEHRFGDEAFQFFPVFDVVVDRHRSGTQCRRERPHTQAAEPVLVDDLDRLRPHLVEGESCPHVEARPPRSGEPLTRTPYVS